MDGIRESSVRCLSAATGASMLQGFHDPEPIRERFYN
jgi:hypothetical protein